MFGGRECIFYFPAGLVLLRVGSGKCMEERQHDKMLVSKLAAYGVNTLAFVIISIFKSYLELHTSISQDVHRYLYASQII